MQDLTIHDLDDATVHRLREAADRNGRTLEDEARTVLAAGTAGGDVRPDNMADRIRARVEAASEAERPTATGESLYDAVRRRFAPLGGVDLPDIPREPMRDPPDFS